MEWLQIGLMLMDGALKFIRNQGVYLTLYNQSSRVKSEEVLIVIGIIYSLETSEMTV